ncbi:MAG: hypothetical protein ACRYG2_20710 [Janthinobacterium lividum]
MRRSYPRRPRIKHGAAARGRRWAGLCAQLVRVGGEGSGFVVLALDDDEDRPQALATSLIEGLTTSTSGSVPEDARRRLPH